MAYSHSRLRKTLAVVRVLAGMVFVSLGWFKITSLGFAKVLFPNYLDAGIQGGAVEWIRPALEWMMSVGPGRVGVTIGFIELFIGIAMVLGLAVRPASMVGMLYSLGLLLATWNQAEGTPSLMQTAEHQFRNLFPFLVFLVLGVGHAGETWGVGALYHHHRALKWQRENALERAQEPPAEPEEEQDVGSFEEFLDREERAAAARTHAWSASDQE